MCSNPRVQKVVVSPIALHSWGAPLCLAWEWQQGDPPSAPVKWQVRTGSYNRSAAGLRSCKVWHWRREWSPQTGILLLPALTVACSLCIPTASEERLEVQSKTPLFLNLSSCPRTLVHLIAVSVHSEILTISLSAPAKHVLSICPWNQPSLRKVIKVVVCWMNHAHLFFSFFFLFSALPSRNRPRPPPHFTPVTTELLPCNLLCLRSFVFLQTVFETLHPLTSGKGTGTAHTFILALGSSSDKLAYFSAWHWGVWVGRGGFISPELLMHLKWAL